MWVWGGISSLIFCYLSPLWEEDQSQLDCHRSCSNLHSNSKNSTWIVCGLQPERSQDQAFPWRNFRHFRNASWRYALIERISNEKGILDVRILCRHSLTATLRSSSLENRYSIRLWNEEMFSLLELSSFFYVFIQVRSSNYGHSL